MPHFTIITPTYRRRDGVLAAITSVQQQAYQRWTMIIINDNPNDGTRDVIAALTDERLIYHEHNENRGANAARNTGLDAVPAASTHIIFLDDDDTLAPNALATLAERLATSPYPWLVTARGTSLSTPTTIAPHSGCEYHYLRDYLVYRRFQGDATHCIDTKYSNGTIATLRFPAIHNGEEWLFYAALGRYTPFWYEAIVTTLTSGYTATGLNFRRRGTREQLALLPHLWRESVARHLALQPLLWVYLGMRCLRAFIKRT